MRNIIWRLPKKYQNIKILFWVYLRSNSCRHMEDRQCNSSYF
jgi:hypothetical protein